MEAKSGIREAVEKFGGSPTALAAAVGGDVSRQNVEYWLSVGRVPDGKCPAVAIASGVPVQRLNPLHDWDLVRRSLDASAAAVDRQSSLQARA